MKKLTLNKITVFNLNSKLTYYEMGKIYGASVVNPTCICNQTNSCSNFLGCCTTPKAAANS
ncbi:MAG: hypothetical protein KAW12_12930 [Candidatus Aminicenantes bacterium]|nr:hypothetical protein [Candidatus Aminicenantes bacterium]